MNVQLISIVTKLLKIAGALVALYGVITAALFAIMLQSPDKFAGKVTHDLPSITEEDTQALRNVGWTDDQIFYTITVSSLFNFYNRWVTSSGVPAVSHEGHRKHAQVIAHNGYIRK